MRDQDDLLGGLPALAQDALDAGRGDGDRVGVPVGEALDRPRAGHRRPVVQRSELDRCVGPEVGDVQQQRARLSRAIATPAAAVNSGGVSTITTSATPARTAQARAESANEVWLSRRRATPRLGAG